MPNCCPSVRSVCSKHSLIHQYILNKYAPCFIALKFQGEQQCNAELFLAILWQNSDWNKIRIQMDREEVSYASGVI